MCGRFSLRTALDELARLFDAAPANDLPDLPDYNICPTDRVLAVTASGQGRRLGALRWGFVPHWYKSPTDGPLLINARAETIAEKPAFAQACRQRRCLIPANGFYEWSKAADGTRLPWYVERRDGAPMIFAGVWQNWAQGAARLSTCAIVTTAAAGPIADIHHRMPVILEPQDWAKWLGQDGPGAAPLMRPAPAETLSVYRVGPAVNSNRATGAELTRPLVDQANGSSG